jgi:hypothetical protein
MLSGIEIPGSSADTGTPPLSDLDKLNLIREEYEELEVQEKDALDAAMAHSREIFGIQDIAGNMGASQLRRTTAIKNNYRGLGRAVGRSQIQSRFDFQISLNIKK